MQGRNIDELRVFQDENGMQGLEAHGSEWQYTSRANPDEPYGEAELDTVSAAFVERVVAARYDLIEEVAREREPRELRYRVVSAGRVGLLAVEITRIVQPGPPHDDVAVHEVLGPNYDALVDLPDQIENWKRLLIAAGHKKAWLGSQSSFFEAYDYPAYRNRREAVLICSARSWEELVSKLRSKVPGLTDETLRKASEGLSLSRPAGAAAGTR